MFWVQWAEKYYSAGRSIIYSCCVASPGKNTYISICVGTTEYAGRENGGPSESWEVKMQDITLMNQVSVHENDGPSKSRGMKMQGKENAGHEIAAHKNTDLTGWYWICRTWKYGTKKLDIGNGWHDTISKVTWSEVTGCWFADSGPPSQRSAITKVRHRKGPPSRKKRSPWWCMK